MMRFNLNKIMLAFAVGIFVFVASPAISHHTGISLFAVLHAADGHDSGHSSGGHKGKGPKYRGGRTDQGHGGDGGHKGKSSSSHGGGSKTLEDTVFHSDGGHTGGSSGHDEGGHEETDGTDTHDHTEPH